MWTIEQLNYFAGILDGEGSIAIEKMSPCKARPYHYFTPRLCIINTNNDLIEWLIKNFGGSRNTRTKIKGRRPCYRWHVFGQDLERILRAVFPYMIVKRQLVILVLEFRDTVGKTGWNVTEEIRNKREQLYLRSRELNKIGE